MCDLIHACALALHARIEALHLLHTSDASVLDGASPSAWCALPHCPLPLAFCEPRSLSGSEDDDDGSRAGEFAEQLASLETLTTVRTILVKAHVTLNVQPETTVLAIFLIERLVNAVGARFGPLRLRTLRMLLACGVAIASKYHDDYDISLHGIRRCVLENRVPAKTFARCESFFLARLRYRVHCDPALYARYHGELLELLVARKAALAEVWICPTYLPILGVSLRPLSPSAPAARTLSERSGSSESATAAAALTFGFNAHGRSSSELVEREAEVEAEDLHHVSWCRRLCW